MATRRYRWSSHLMHKVTLIDKQTMPANKNKEGLSWSDRNAESIRKDNESAVQNEEGGRREIEVINKVMIDQNWSKQMRREIGLIWAIE